MKKLFLLAPMLLAACAPTSSSTAHLAPNELIVETDASKVIVDQSSMRSPEDAAGYVGYVLISSLPHRSSVMLPSSYGDFALVAYEDGNKFQVLSGKNAPLHIRNKWRSVNVITGNTIDVNWESRPMGGTRLNVKVRASSSDATVDTRSIEDQAVARFLESKSVRLVERGR